MVITELLEQGKSFSLGNASEVAGIIQHDAAAFTETFTQMLHHPDKWVQLKAGNAVEKAARINPELLLPHQKELLQALPEMKQTEVVWHVALLLSYLPLEEDDLALAVNALFHWLDTIPHRFVKVNCLQSLAVLALQHDWLQAEVIPTLEAALDHESPSIRARARILLKKFQPKKSRRSA